MNDRDFTNIVERTCPVCGKTFVPMPKHAHKARDKDERIVLLCSQGCSCRFRNGKADRKECAG